MVMVFVLESKTLYLLCDLYCAGNMYLGLCLSQLEIVDARIATRNGRGQHRN
jgi:hypothetical protein